MFTPNFLRPPCAISFSPSINMSFFRESPYAVLPNRMVKHIDRILLGHINLNIIKTQFHMIADLIRGKIDILLISETKVDSTFPTLKYTATRHLFVKI